MQCKATITEFDVNDPNDQELIEKLQLRNLEAYGWHQAFSTPGSRIDRYDSANTLRVLQEIEDVKPGVSGYASAKRPDSRVFKVDVAGETYVVGEKFMKLYAQAIDVSRWFLYRCSENGDEVESFAEKKTLTPKRTYCIPFVKNFTLSIYSIEFIKFIAFVVFVAFTGHAFHAAYYNTMYTEHFDTQEYPAKLLTMFHNGYEFVQQNERISICLCIWIQWRM